MMARIERSRAGLHLFLLPARHFSSKDISITSASFKADPRGLQERFVGGSTLSLSAEDSSLQGRASLGNQSDVHSAERKVGRGGSKRHESQKELILNSIITSISIMMWCEFPDCFSKKPHHHAHYASISPISIIQRKQATE